MTRRYRKKHPIKTFILIFIIIACIYSLITCDNVPQKIKQPIKQVVSQVVEKIPELPINIGSQTTSIPGGLEIPKHNKDKEIVSHTGYTLSYSEEHEQPYWVAYTLTKEMVQGNTPRKDNFRPDPSISTGSASLADYKGSGYDRGHLVPAADLRYSKESMDDSFYMSNMSPQDPNFNREIWADLEATVRQFAYDNGSIFVVTGPVLTDGPYKTIGDNKVTIPKRYYKAILDYTQPELKTIGFLLDNKNSSKPLSSFACSIDYLEDVTGIDFFPNLPDKEEVYLESSYNINSWNWKTYY